MIAVRDAHGWREDGDRLGKPAAAPELATRRATKQSRSGKNTRHKPKMPTKKAAVKTKANKAKAAAPAKKKAAAKKR